MGLKAALLCLGIALCAPPSFAADDEVSRHLVAGDEAAQQGRYASAKAEYEAAIALDPARPDAWYDLGLLYGQMADFASAEAAFRHSIQLDANSAKAHCRLGQTLVADPRRQQDWKAAVAEFREAIRLQPEYPEAESFLGLGLNNLGQTEEAVKTLQHAVELDPKLAASHLNLAVAFESSNRLEEAVAEYKAALLSKPNAPETEASLASLYVRMGKPAEAEQEFRTALRLNPDLLDAHFGLARLLKSEKKTGEASVELAETQELNEREPHRVQALELSNEGLELAAKEDLPGALERLRKAVQLKPDYGIAHYNLGLLLADTGAFPASGDELVKAVSLIPTEAKIWFNLGRVLRKMGDVRGAFEVVSWAAWLVPSNTSFAAERNALKPAGAPTPSAQKETACSDAAPCTGPDPRQPNFGATSDTASAHAVFASELRGRGDNAGAVGELIRALALKPDALETRRALAESYIALAQWIPAFLEYHKVLLVEGESEDTHLALGKILMAEGKPADAVMEYRLALGQSPASAAAKAGLEAGLKTSARPNPAIH